MAKTVTDDEHSGHDYRTLTVDELKNCVVRYWKEIKGLEAEKKDIVESVNTSVKELKTKIDDVVYWIGVRETEAERAKLEDAAEAALRGK